MHTSMVQQEPVTIQQYSKQSMLSSVRNFSPRRQFSYIHLSQKIYRSTRVKCYVHNSARACRKFSNIEDLHYKDQLILLKVQPPSVLLTYGYQLWSSKPCKSTTKDVKSTQKQPGCKKKVRPCLKWPV